MARLIRAFTTQLKDLELYQRWQVEENRTERQEVRRLEGQLVTLPEATQSVPVIGDELKDSTIGEAASEEPYRTRFGLPACQAGAVSGA